MAKATAKAKAPAKKRRRKSNILLVVIFIIGLSLLLYPSFANYWNSTRSTHLITAYTHMMNSMDEKTAEQELEKAIAYNEDLAETGFAYAPTQEQKKRYEATLNPDGTGLIGYVEIGSLGVSLPVYHGTSAAVLQVAVGHLDWSSLPVGGETSHCVLSGHRGLPSAKLFTDLDEMREGDTFELHVLNQTYTYEVDQIRTVKPAELKDLRLEEGQDYCTLVTCTPYGINSHRLLVRGHRVSNDMGAVVISEAVKIEPLVVASVLAIPLLIIAILLFLRPNPRRYEDLGDFQADKALVEIQGEIQKG